jgi:PAS domain S-box-containing protein
VLDIELAVMLETYRDAFVERIQHVERQERLDIGSALARAEHRYVNAVELSMVLIVGLDRSGAVQLFNREAERVTGFARDEVLGVPFISALELESPSDLPNLLAQGLAGLSSSQTCETTLLTRSGKIRDVVWHFSFAGEQAGDDVVLFAMGQDLTDQKALAERTRQTEKLAAIGTLAAGLAHEIRNPLNGAQLHVSFLERAIKRKAPEPAMLEATHVVADEIRRLADLVSEFLDFARPRPLQIKPISLFKISEHAKTMLSSLAEEHEITLFCDMPSSDLEFPGDQDKLLQVLLNLLKNAIEAIAESQGSRVTLRGRREPRNVVIEVEDDGPGISSVDSPIFDAFFSTKEGGTGLGLAITHRIVTDHGGSIDCSSQFGRTIFRIRLPMDRIQDHPHEQD